MLHLLCQWVKESVFWPQHIISCCLYSFMPLVSLSPHQDVMIDMSRSKISSFPFSHVIILTLTSLLEQPKMIHQILTTQKDQVLSLAKWHYREFLSSNMKTKSEICVKQQCPHNCTWLQKRSWGKKTAKFFHLSHTKGIFLSPALYGQHQVLILPLAMILIFSSPRLRPAPSVQQCCLYLFHSAWDIWVSVNRFPSPAPIAVRVRQAYRSLAFSGESHLLLNFPLPLPLLFFFFTKQTVNSTFPPSGGHTSTA